MRWRMFERFRVFKLVQIGINDGSITAMGVEVSTCARKVEDGAILLYGTWQFDNQYKPGQTRETHILIWYNTVK